MAREGSLFLLFSALCLCLTISRPSLVALPTGDPCAVRTDDVRCAHVPPCQSKASYVVLDGFLVTNVAGQVPARQATTVRVCWQDKGILVRGNASDAFIFTPWTHCNDEVFRESDVMEVFMAPVDDPTDNPIWYHEIDTAPSAALWVGHSNNSLGNASNCAAEDHCVPGTLPCRGLNDFSPVPLSVSVTNGTGWWATELFLPFSLFPKPAQSPPSPAIWPLYRANFYRYDYADGPEADYELTGWTPTHNPSFHIPARFGVLVLVE